MGFWRLNMDNNILWLIHKSFHFHFFLGYALHGFTDSLRYYREAVLLLTACVISMVSVIYFLIKKSVHFWL
uniref:Uncharacterized protein n=1 Tax=Rhizophora mucronata TaxID=61149 RepID=A0A2P2QNT8_RHIMU